MPVLAALATLMGAPASAGVPVSQWRQTLTPHFALKHEAVWLPPGLTMSAERIHSRLRLDLGMFSPEMARERVNLFVYRDQASFQAGEFRPPPWSNGLALYERRAVAFPAMKDQRKLLQVLAHETTHLLFDGYWRQARRRAPAWLNEGLAMTQEAESPERPETTVWYQMMAVDAKRRFAPLERFFATESGDLHDDQDQVADWYVQAYAVTYFLLRKHSRLQFKGFCAQLRDGKSASEALWLAYRYRKVADLEARWKAWLADPAHKRRVYAMAESTRADPAPDRDVIFKPFRLIEPTARPAARPALGSPD